MIILKNLTEEEIDLFCGIVPVISDGSGILIIPSDCKEDLLEVLESVEWIELEV